MSRLTDNIADFFFPNRCPFCDGFIPWNSLCCENCRDKLETADFCPVCGHSPCECRTRSFSYDGCAVASLYDGRVRDGVLRFKYRCGFNTAKYFLPKLCELLYSYGYDPQSIVTAVPMAKNRRNMTGYNQSEYLAKLVSKSLKLNRDFKLISKRASAVIQHSLSGDERREAVKGAFYPHKKHRNIAGRTVILCDDIITTGSTLSECSAVLKGMGAKRIICAAVSGTAFRPQIGEEQN